MVLASWTKWLPELKKKKKKKKKKRKKKENIETTSPMSVVQFQNYLREMFL